MDYCYLCTWYIKKYALCRELKLNPHCVSLEWVVESMKRGKRVPESEYTFPPPPTATAAKVPESIKREKRVPETEYALPSPRTETAAKLPRYQHQRALSERSVPSVRVHLPHSFYRHCTVPSFTREHDEREVSTRERVHLPPSYSHCLQGK